MQKYRFQWESDYEKGPIPNFSLSVAGDDSFWPPERKQVIAFKTHSRSNKVWNIAMNLTWICSYKHFIIRPFQCILPHLVWWYWRIVIYRYEWRKLPSKPWYPILACISHLVGWFLKLSFNAKPTVLHGVHIGPETTVLLGTGWITSVCSSVLMTSIYSHKI